MDDRQAELKSLKKAYKKQRRKAMWGWDVLWYTLLALLLLAVGMVLYMVFYSSFVIRILDLYVWTPIKNFVGIRQSLLPLGRFVLNYGIWCALGFGVLFSGTWILRNRALSKARRFDSYLDYMTLKNTLKTEKDEARIK